MKKTTLLTPFSLVLALGLTPVARAENNTFTYQGKLVDDCCPANGFYQMRFKLCATDAGAQVTGTPVQQHLMFVTNGLFTTNLNFGTGSQVFDGSPRWLEIEVSPNTAIPSFVALLPRTELSRTPEAVFAQKAGSIAAGQVVKSLNGLKDDVRLTAGANITLTPSGNSIQISSSGPGSSWGLAGNAGTVPGVSFLGTTDGQPLEMRAPFVGVNRSTPVTGADAFSVRSPATTGFGGMYVDTAGAGKPFYGYALQGAARAWHYLDGSDGNKWKLDNGGVRLTVTPAGNVGIGTTIPDAKLDAVLTGAGAAVRGSHSGSGVYGELASATLADEFWTFAGVYGSGGVGAYAGLFEGDVSIRGNLDAGEISGYNGRADSSATAVTGESRSGYGVKGIGGNIGVFAQNPNSGTVAYLATSGLAADFYGNVYVHGTVTQTSDRNAKENFAPVDTRAILEKVAGLPVATWSYKTDKGVRHLGTMAQDFHAAFAVGLDDKSISSVDADGVALAAIQGLYQLLQEKEARMEKLHAKIAELADTVATLTSQK